MFDEKNLISLAVFEVSVCPSTTRSTIILSRNFRTIFFAKFRIIFIAKFPHFLFRENFTLLTKQIEAKFREKHENFRIFLERTKCENEAKWSRKTFFAKRIFLFAGKPSPKCVNRWEFRLQFLLKTF